jgi:hypothetical protein
MKYHLLSTLLLPAALFLSGCEKPSDPAAAQSDVTPEEAQAIARDAYLYGFPMVMNYKTMWNYAVDKDNPEYKGPFNEVSCEARLFTPEDKAVVTPNADTPYCMFWMDLRAEPLVLSVPEMDPDRYYSFQLIDLYTHNFALCRQPHHRQRGRPLPARRAGLGRHEAGGHHRRHPIRNRLHPQYHPDAVVWSG